MTVKIVIEGVETVLPEGTQIIIGGDEFIKIDFEALQKDLARLTKIFNEHVNPTGVGPTSPIPLFPSRWQRIKRWFRNLFQVRKAS